jgi:hypothetical protein
VGSLTELQKVLALAIYPNLQRLAVVQTEHAHKAFAVYPPAVVADQNTKGLNGGQGYEIPDFLKRMNLDTKFLHYFPSGAVQNGKSYV